MTQLTASQETAAAAVEDQWLAAGLATGPADRDAAAAGVALAYTAAGLPPPARVFWLGSPRAGAVAAALLSGAVAELPDVPWVRDVERELTRQGWRPGQPVGRPVRTAVRTTPWARARAEGLAMFGVQGWAQLSAAAGRRSWALIMDRVAGRVRGRLREDLAELPGDLAGAASRAVLDAVYGQHDAAWLCTFAAAAQLTAARDPLPDGPAGLAGGDAIGSGPADPAGGDAVGSGLAGLAATAREIGWWWPFAEAAVLTERPTVLSRDNVGRLHGEEAAMRFADGYELWAWRGMPIPPALAADLPTLTADRIRAEENAELRRVLLEHYGYERYLRESGARKRHTDDTGTLWHLDLPGDEPLVMVEVVNATPEPDGTSRIYWLRVPPETGTARAGVAWTFGLTADEYHPQVQT